MRDLGTLPTWIGDYMAIPFVEGGRTRDGADCYGLLRLVLAERFNVVIPEDPVGAWPRDLDRAGKIDLARRVERARDAWREMRRTEIRPGLCILLRVEGRPMHVGIVLNERAFLHTDRDAGVNVESYVEGMWSGNRVLGFYEYRGPA